MLAIGIGIFVVIQVIVLTFVLALCRSAAKTDEAFERARMADQRHWSNLPDHQKSPAAKPSGRLASPVRVQNR